MKDLVKKLALVPLFIMLTYELDEGEVDTEANFDNPCDPQVFSSQEAADEWIKEHGDTENFHYEVYEAKCDSMWLEDDEAEEEETADNELEPTEG